MASSINQLSELHGIRLSAVEEIVANKICALLGRWEVRDLIDLLALEREGFRVENHLDDAAKKDGGVTAATLAWVLSSLQIPEKLPEGFDQPTLEAFRSELERRMRAVAAAQAKPR